MTVLHVLRHQQRMNKQFMFLLIKSNTFMTPFSLFRKPHLLVPSNLTTINVDPAYHFENLGIVSNLSKVICKISLVNWNLWLLKAMLTFSSGYKRTPATYTVNQWQSLLKVQKSFYSYCPLEKLSSKQYNTSLHIDLKTPTRIYTCIYFNNVWQVNCKN